MTMQMKKIKKAMKKVGLFLKLQPILPQKSLLTIYKSFIRHHLDYCNVIYDHPAAEIFPISIEIAQYNKALGVTG